MPGLYENERFPEDDWRNASATPAMPAPQEPQPQQSPQAEQPAAPQQQTAAEPAKPKEEGYGVMHAIVDAFASRLKFGTPLLNVERARLAQAEEYRRAEATKLAMEQTKAAMKRENAFRKLAPSMISLAKEGGAYQNDLGHLAEAINADEDAQEFAGGRVAAARTGAIGANGQEVWDWTTTDPKTGRTSTIKLTPQELTERAYAAQDPTTQRRMLEIAKEADLNDRIAAERFMKYNSEGPLAKLAHGLPLSPVEKYLYLRAENERMPSGSKLHDWQLLEMAGVKQQAEWKPTGTLVPMSDGTYGQRMLNERTGEIKTDKVAGSSWREMKQNTASMAEKWIGSYWPIHDAMEPYELAAIGIAATTLNGEQDPNKQRVLMNKVLFEFQDWVEQSKGKINDQGNKRDITRADMRAKMDELLKKAGPGSGNESKSAGAPDETEEQALRRRNNERNEQRARAGQAEYRKYIQGEKAMTPSAGGQALKAAEVRAAPAMGVAAASQPRMTQPGSLAEQIVQGMDQWYQQNRAAAAERPAKRRIQNE
jgi:hypothetical protein